MLQILKSCFDFGGGTTDEIGAEIVIAVNPLVLTCIWFSIKSSFYRQSRIIILIKCM